VILSLVPLFYQKMVHCNETYNMNFCFPIKCVKDVVDLNALLKIKFEVLLPSFKNVSYFIDMILMFMSYFGGKYS